MGISVLPLILIVTLLFIWGILLVLAILDCNSYSNRIVHIDQISHRPLQMRLITDRRIEERINNKWNFKIIVVGDNEEGKEFLVSKFTRGGFEENYKQTIGASFSTKEIKFANKLVKLLFWDIAYGKDYNFLHPSFFKNSYGAIIILDLSKSDYRKRFEEIIHNILKYSGDLPVILLTFNKKSEEFHYFSGGGLILTTNDFTGSIDFKSSLKLCKNPDIILEKLGEYLADKYETLLFLKPFHRLLSSKTEYKINDFLKLSLESGNTNIYVGGKLFKQCKYLFLNIPVAKNADYNEIESIDEAADKLDHSMESGNPKKYQLPPDVEFWGHCSNLQAWFENAYDTRLLHSNLAFPLLRALGEAGDPLAQKVFKQAIIQRFAYGYPGVVQYLLTENYLEYLDENEIKSLLNDQNFIKCLPRWFIQLRDIPTWFLKRIKLKLNKMKCPLCGARISQDQIKNFLESNQLKCLLCYSDIV